MPGDKKKKNAGHDAIYTRLKMGHPRARRGVRARKAGRLTRRVSERQGWEGLSEAAVLSALTWVLAICLFYNYLQTVHAYSSFFLECILYFKINHWENLG